MRTRYLPGVLCALLVAFSSCQKEYDGGANTGGTSTANIIFKFKFDSTQARLNNIGQPSVMAAGHAGMHAEMNSMSAHYLELAPNALTALGNGEVLYKAAETAIGGSNAIDFSKATLTPDGGIFLTVPVKDIPRGEYEYLRVSLAYQNADAKMHIDTVIAMQAGNIPFSGDFPCTIAGFIGYNSYITNFKVKTKDIAVNGNREQGFWGFECTADILGTPFTFTSSGQSPKGATTVVNPINATSPVPPGSCVVTGAFNGGAKLRITGSETKDIVVVISLSVNKSFEWIDTNGNGKWDPTKGEAVADMGIRGMIPFIQ